MNNKYKICVVGDGSVGKTTWIRRLLTHTAERRYVATLGVQVHPIHIETNKGVFIFNMWDTAGQERFGGLRDGYYILSDAFIFIHTSDLSTLEKWKKCSANYSSGRPRITLCNTHEPSIEGDRSPVWKSPIRTSSMPSPTVAQRSTYLLAISSQTLRGIHTFTVNSKTCS